jgi:hypothetical protein
LSSAADQPDEARCPHCPNKQRFGAEGEELDGDVEQLLDVIEELVRERNSGFGFPADLTQLEKELIVIWDDIVASFERMHQQRITMLIEALAQVK